MLLTSLTRALPDRNALATAVFVASVVVAGASHANEIADGCKAFAADNGTDAAGCDCLGDAADSDPALFDALLLIETADDMAALSADHRAMIAACFPDEGSANPDKAD